MIVPAGKPPEKLVFHGQQFGMLEWMRFPASKFSISAGVPPSLLC
jgi:hypothetical protein